MWSYSGDPSSSDRDMVRFNTGLTDSTDPLIQDEEIDALLATHGVMNTSIRVARRVAAKFARRADQAIGDYRERFNQRAREYRALAEALEGEKAQAGFTAIVGGISQDDKEEQRDDSDRVNPRFRRGQFDRQELKSS